MMVIILELIFVDFLLYLLVDELGLIMTSHFTDEKTESKRVM